jgi:hypothetical protein
MKEIKYQIIKVPISAAGESIKFSADTDKMYKRITGLFASLPEDKAVPGTTLELKISDKEIFPEEYELKMVTTGQNVSPNSRFLGLSEEAFGNHIEGRLTDSGRADSYPFVAKLYLRLEDRH